MGRDSKKKKKHKKHKKEKREKKYSSSESSSEEEEWVEEGTQQQTDFQHNAKQPESSSREDWMDISEKLFATVSRQDLKKSKIKEPVDKKPTIESLGQSERELNPYWKNGGTGLPEEKADGSDVMGTVGDMGVDWLKRALSRAKQRALDENISLEEVVAETWGSLENLNNLIKEAELKSKKEKYIKDQYKNTSNREKVDPRKYAYDGERSKNEVRNFAESRRKDNYAPDSENRRPHRRTSPYAKERDSEERRRYRERSSDRYKESRKKPLAFMKPSEDEEVPKSDFIKTKIEDTNSYVKKGWRKDDKRISKRINDSEPHYNKEISSKSSESTYEQKQPEKEKTHHLQDKKEKPEILTLEEMNKIGAQMIKAEMMDDKELYIKLKERLDKAQAWLKGNKKDEESLREVVLTKTDRRGFTQPVLASSSQPSKSKRLKVQTHEDGKRVRYFADDDKHSLNDLYQKEKFISAADENEMYSRLASKGIGKDESARDMEDMFEETARVDKSDEWKEFRERQKAVLENDKREKALDRCIWCIDSATAQRHLIVSILEKVYLSVPPYGSVTEGHCLIIPQHHTPCSTLLDEDVWEEVMDLRKILVNMFLKDDKDVIFYENVKNFNKFPHMVLHCIPVPKETGDVAPIYFKKAISECEMEWSNNKKVVDLKGRNVRKAIPKGLPYFFVDFGMDSGYAHVIEDEALFPRNFAEEIIGGMMDLDHTIWRKQRKDDLEVQKKKAQSFIKNFKEFMSKK